MSVPRLFKGSAKPGTSRDALDRMGDAVLTPVRPPTRTMSLSVPIVSSQDGPRMAGVSNFGGKKAAPFGKGKASAPSNVKRTAAKTAVLSGKQSKLPPALQAAIARKRGSKNGK